MSILVRVCIWVLRFYKLEALELLKECSWAPLSFVLQIVAKLLRSCLCFFDAINELHAMDEKCSTTFSLESESGFYDNKKP